MKKCDYPVITLCMARQQSKPSGQWPDQKYSMFIHIVIKN